MSCSSHGPGCSPHWYRCWSMTSAQLAAPAAAPTTCASARGSGCCPARARYAVTASATRRSRLRTSRPYAEPRGPCGLLVRVVARGILVRGVVVRPRWLEHPDRRRDLVEGVAAVEQAAHREEDLALGVVVADVQWR